MENSPKGAQNWLKISILIVYNAIKKLTTQIFNTLSLSYSRRILKAPRGVFWPKKRRNKQNIFPSVPLKEISDPAEKAYSDYLYSSGCKIITKKESIGQLKGVKSIFESVINAHSKLIPLRIFLNAAS